MGAPRRIQLRRSAGWRKPPAAVVVARPTRWGNPFRVGAPSPLDGAPMTRAAAVAAYRRWLAGRPEVAARARAELRGRDLACWCRPADPCHGDVLLEVANAPDRPARSRPALS